MRAELGHLFLRARGWRCVGEVPLAPKYVLPCAPHTSNWDFVYMQAYALAQGLEVHWIGKDTLFRGPMGPLMRRLGGIAVDRSHAEGVVEAMVRAFASRERLVLAIAPEGSRSRRDVWKSGFYRIAVAAQVPIALGGIDYARRELEIGPCFQPSGDVRADMDRVRAFYRGKVGKYPEDFGEVRLREEGPAGASP